MEYTKDLILNIRYDESSNTLRLKTTNCISKLLKKHKLAATICAIFVMLTIMDFVLVSNFMRILTVVK